MMNNDNAKTTVRSRRFPFRPESDAMREQSANVLPIGTHLGEFEIQDVIGEGGFGIVYLAYDHSLERRVALKEYMPSGLATRTAAMAVTVRSQAHLETYTIGLKSFINEARMLAQFDSPALVKVHLFWEGNGTAYMVMPYYEGVTLKQALREKRIKPSEPWLRLLLADLFDAIDIIHHARCLHRDIAPDNILLLKDGRPLLLDFGAARRVIGDLTQCLTAILKPGFAPIEQYADIPGLRQGAWTDIYALAAVVYYLIAGKAPPPAVARMVHDELLPAGEAGKGRYSSSFLAALDKALAVKPEQRFQSIADMRRALNILEAVPRTLPQESSSWDATAIKTAPIGNVKADPAPPKPAAAPQPATKSAMEELTAVHAGSAEPAGKAAAAPVERTRPLAEGKQPRPQPAAEAPPATLAPESPHAATTWRKYVNPAWLAVAAALGSAVAAGAYLGTNRSQDKAAEHAFIVSEGAGEFGSSAAGAPGQAAPSNHKPALGSPAVSAEMLSEIDVWRKASAADLAAGYEKYLKQYPKGSFAAIARLRLDRLQAHSSAPSAPGATPPPAPTQAEGQKKSGADTLAATPKLAPAKVEEEAWIRASTLNGESSYKAYLKTYPKGRYAALAKDRLAGLKQALTAQEKPQPPVMAIPDMVAQADDKSAGGAPTVPATEKQSGATQSSANRGAAGTSDTLASAKPAEPAITPAAKLPVPTPEPAPVTGNRTVALDNQIITGDFTADPKSGRVTGHVRIAWANGDRYEGSLVRGMKEGRGRFVWRNGQRYTGDWARDLPNGKGAFVFADGSRYDGEVKDGMRHGRGITRFRNGDVYNGEWSNGKTNGYGRYTWADGGYWEGEFSAGQRTENGKMVYAPPPAQSTQGTADAAASAGDGGPAAGSGKTENYLTEMPSNVAGHDDAARRNND